MGNFKNLLYNYITTNLRLLVTYGLVTILFYQIRSRKLLLQAQRGKWGMNGTTILNDIR